MLEILTYTLVGIGGVAGATAVIPTLKFFKDKKLEKHSWENTKVEKMKQIGTVEKLSILPLVDYYAKNDELVGESGVSYLIKADDEQVLFDVGFNMKNQHPSPLLENMQKLNVNLNAIGSIFISHLHPDHVGGMKAKRNATFSLSGENINLQNVKAYVPVKMAHDSAKVQVLEEPTRISDGIVSLGNISRAIWGMGLTEEQALAVNVSGKGIVIIVGCGHQTTEKILERAKHLFDEPIYGIIGGLHFPVTTRNDRVFNIRRILGTGKLPLSRISESDVESTIKNICEKNLEFIGISAHDSCDWTLDRFRNAFGSKYKEILVGEEIIIAS